jgi:hypothetical protein
VHDDKALSELYAIGVVGAIAINMLCCWHSKELPIGRWERRGLLAIGILMTAIGLTIVYAKPHAAYFAGSIIVGVLIARFFVRRAAAASATREPLPTPAAGWLQEIKDASRQLPASKARIMLAARGRDNAEFAVDLARRRQAALFTIYVRTLRMLDVYERFAEDYMAMPVLKGQKTESEKFPGAVNTYSIEAMMQDKKALQAGTSHMLGQNFAKMFDTMYQSKEGQKEYVWQTSWGVSTRLIGALIMTHSDDQGLVVPPKLAPTHLVIIIIGKTPEERGLVRARAHALADEAKKAGIRVLVDDDESKGPGFKYAEYELRGVCVRAEMGPKDLEKGQVVLARRDAKAANPGEKPPKEFVNLDAAVKRVSEILDEQQKNLFEKAKAFRAANTHEVNTLEELKAKADEGFLLAHWDGTPETEKRFKDEFGLTTRNRPFELKQEPGKCVLTGNPSSGRIVFARAY